MTDTTTTTKLVMPPGFIKKKTDQIEMPVSAGLGPPLGTIAPWFLIHSWSLWAPDNCDFTEKDFPFIRKVKFGTGSFRYYFASDQFEAARACSEASSGHNPSKIVMMQTAVEEVLNMTPEAKEKYIDSAGPIMTYEYDSSTWRSKKHYYKGMLLFMPSLVAALARTFGVENDWNVDEWRTLDLELYRLRQLEEQDAVEYGRQYGDREPDVVVFTDDRHWELIGHPDVRTTDDPSHWRHSVMGKQRADLWSLLGEPDVERYLPMGYEVRSNVQQFVTESPQLSQLLDAGVGSWEEPVFARVARLPDPAVSAGHKGPGQDSTFRPALPFFTDIYSDEDAAKKAAEEELARRASGGDGGSPTEAAVKEAVDAAFGDDDDLSWIPEGVWRQYPDSYKETVAELKAEHGKAPRPVQLKKVGEYLKQYEEDAGEEFGATAAQIVDGFSKVF